MFIKCFICGMQNLFSSDKILNLIINMCPFRDPWAARVDPIALSIDHGPVKSSINKMP